MKNTWAILCRSASIDKNTNNISLDRVLESIKVVLPSEAIKGIKREGKPVLVQFEYALVSLWTKEQREKSKDVRKEATVELVAPDGKTLSELKMTIQIEAAKRRTRVVLSSNAILLMGGGDYEFRIRLKGRSGAEQVVVPLEVIIKEENS